MCVLVEGDKSGIYVTPLISGNKSKLKNKGNTPNFNTKIKTFKKILFYP
jgi:hypothetical protein